MRVRFAFLLGRTPNRPRREHVSPRSPTYRLGLQFCADSCAEVVLEVAYPKVCYYRPLFEGKAPDLVTTRYQHDDKPYRVLESFKQTQHSIRRKENREEINELGAGESRRSDVFSRLVLANESDMEKLPLDAQELVR